MSQNQNGRHMRSMKSDDYQHLSVNIMLKVKRRETFKFLSNYSKDEIILRIVKLEATKFTRMVSGLMWPGAECGV